MILLFIPNVCNPWFWFYHVLPNRLPFVKLCIRDFCSYGINFILVEYLTERVKASALACAELLGIVRGSYIHSLADLQRGGSQPLEAEGSMIGYCAALGFLLKKINDLL